MRYLFLTYYYKPDGKIDEVMTLATKVRSKDWQTVNVMLDFQEQKVLKCSVRDTNVPKEWDRVVGYYYQHYPATFERLFQENGHEIPAPPQTVE